MIGSRASSCARLASDRLVSTTAAWPACEERPHAIACASAGASAAAAGKLPGRFVVRGAPLARRGKVVALLDQRLRTAARRGGRGLPLALSARPCAREPRRHFGRRVLPANPWSPSGPGDHRRRPNARNGRGAELHGTAETAAREAAEGQALGARAPRGTRLRRPRAPRRGGRVADTQRRPRRTHRDPAAAGTGRDGGAGERGAAVGRREDRRRGHRPPRAGGDDPGPGQPYEALEALLQTLSTQPGVGRAKLADMPETEELPSGFASPLTDRRAPRARPPDRAADARRRGTRGGRSGLADRPTLIVADKFGNGPLSTPGGRDVRTAPTCGTAWPTGGARSARLPRCRDRGRRASRTNGTARRERDGGVPGHDAAARHRG